MFIWLKRNTETTFQINTDVTAKNQQMEKAKRALIVGSPDDARSLETVMPNTVKHAHKTTGRRREHEIHTLWLSNQVEHIKPTEIFTK